MSLPGKPQGAGAAQAVMFEEGTGVFHVHRAGVEKRYLDEVEAGRRGAGDHALRPLPRPLGGPDKRVGPEGRAPVPRECRDHAPLPPRPSRSSGPGTGRNHGLRRTENVPRGDVVSAPPPARPNVAHCRRITLGRSTSAPGSSRRSQAQVLRQPSSSGRYAEAPRSPELATKPEGRSLAPALFTLPVLRRLTS